MLIQLFLLLPFLLQKICSLFVQRPLFLILYWNPLIVEFVSFIFGFIFGMVQKQPFWFQNVPFLLFSFLLSILFLQFKLFKLRLAILSSHSFVLEIFHDYIELGQSFISDFIAVSQSFEGLLSHFVSEFIDNVNALLEIVISGIILLKFIIQPHRVKTFSDYLL